MLPISFKHIPRRPSPSHSIRTPVTENDPLGLLNSDSNTSQADNTSDSTLTAATSPPVVADGDGELNRPLGTSVPSDDAQSTNDSGIGDVGGGGAAGSREKLQKDSDEHKHSDSQSTTSSESSLSSPCSPGWKPVHASISDQQIDSKGPPTPPSKTKSATLPTGTTPKVRTGKGLVISSQWVVLGSVARGNDWVHVSFPSTEGLDGDASKY